MHYIVFVLLSFLPSVLHAQVTLTTIIQDFTGVLTGLMRAALGVALVVFLWGVVKMIIGMSSNGGDAGKVISEGKQRMFWGIVALFVLVSLWGIVVLLVQIFGVAPTATQPTHQVIMS